MTVEFRLTDIWRSYWAQRLLWLIDGTLTFNGANAFQIRNVHSYYKDFLNEQRMYLKTEKLVEFLTNWQCGWSKFYECVIDLSKGMADEGFWEQQEVIGIKKWINDLKAVGYIEPVIKKSQVMILVL